MVLPPVDGERERLDADFQKLVVLASRVRWSAEPGPDQPMVGPPSHMLVPYPLLYALEKALIPFDHLTEAHPK